jgi:acyl carrier protein
MLEERVCEFFQKALDIQDEEVTIDTKMEDISEWDSFGQIELLAALEKEFDVKLTYDEMMEINSVASIIRVLENKQKG